MDAIALHRAERGFTLIELVAVIAILAIVGGLGYAALAQRPAQARSVALQFAALVTQARALAAVTGDGNSGASIGVVRAGDEYVATLYTHRPILGASTPPVIAANTAPLRTTTALAIVQSNVTLAPPFALFFATSGHASAIAPYSIGVDPALATEPACAPETGIIIAFIDGVANQGYALSCELAQLDLNTPYPVGSR